MACLHLSKHFLLHFSMKSHWIINKSKSKPHSTLGQKISPSTETVCHAGPINQPSNQKGLMRKSMDLINGSCLPLLCCTGAFILSLF